MCLKDLLNGDAQDLISCSLLSPSFPVRPVQRRKSPGCRQETLISENDLSATRVIFLLFGTYEVQAACSHRTMAIVAEANESNV